MLLLSNLVIHSALSDVLVLQCEQVFACFSLQIVGHDEFRAIRDVSIAYLEYLVLKQPLCFVQTSLPTCFPSEITTSCYHKISKLYNLELYLPILLQPISQALLFICFFPILLILSNYSLKMKT